MPDKRVQDERSTCPERQVGLPTRQAPVWWSATTPTGADVSIKVRTAETSDASALPLWRTCAAAQWGSAPDGNCAGPARFAQYRIELHCALDGEPPVLRGVGLSWE